MREYLECSVNLRTQANLIENGSADLLYQVNFVGTTIEVYISEIEYKQLQKYSQSCEDEEGHFQ